MKHTGSTALAVRVAELERAVAMVQAEIDKTVCRQQTAIDAVLAINKICQQTSAHFRGHKQR